MKHVRNHRTLYNLPHPADRECPPATDVRQVVQCYHQHNRMQSTYDGIGIVVMLLMATLCFGPLVLLLRNPER
jgi:hypothetical protein